MRVVKSPSAGWMLGSIRAQDTDADFKPPRDLA